MPPVSKQPFKDTTHLRVLFTVAYKLKNYGTIQQRLSGCFHLAEGAVNFSWNPKLSLNMQKALYAFVFYAALSPFPADTSSDATGRRLSFFKFKKLICLGLFLFMQSKRLERNSTKTHGKPWGPGRNRDDTNRILPPGEFKAFAFSNSLCT